jgi:hypothetical protein
VTQSGLNRFWVNAGSNQQAGMSMTQVMEANLCQVCEVQVPLEGPVEVVRINRPASPRHEHIVAFGIFAPRQVPQFRNRRRREVVNHALNQYGKGFGTDDDMGALSFMLDPGDPAPMLSLILDGRALPPNGFNGGYYKNPEVDKLLDAATATVNLKQRGEAYRKMQQIAADDAPWIFIDHALQNGAGLKKVKNFKLHPSFYMFFNTIDIQ